MHVAGQNLRKIDELVIVTVSRTEWQAFFDKYRREDPATRETMLWAFYKEMLRYAKTATPLKNTSSSYGFEDVSNIILCRGDHNNFVITPWEPSYTMYTRDYRGVIVRVE